ncbi:MAG TPA: hypothetical protein VGD08_22345 [Stellaceae bacterium]
MPNGDDRLRPTTTGNAGESPVSKSTTSRRMLLRGGVPAVMTLASRPALAGGPACTVSAVLSANLSNAIEQGLNCGVSPGCWKNLAYSDGKWQSTGYDPDQSFASVFGPVPGGSRWTIGTGSLHDALGGNVTITCKIPGKGGSFTSVAVSGNGFTAQSVGALLNAAAFNKYNHYPLSVYDVLSRVTGLWSTQPASKGDVQTLASAIADFFNSQIGKAEECNAEF